MVKGNITINNFHNIDNNMIMNRFNELTMKEQANVVEKEMNNMLYSNSDTLEIVSNNYWEILDTHLINYLSNKSTINEKDNNNNNNNNNKTTFKETKHQSNSDTLLDTISISINEIMNSSPVELLNTRV